MMTTTEVAPVPEMRAIDDGHYITCTRLDWTVLKKISLAQLSCFLKRKVCHSDGGGSGEAGGLSCLFELVVQCNAVLSPAA